MSFIFTCKPESHPWITEQIANWIMETHTTVEWNGRYHLEHRYQWATGIENRCDAENMLVNYLAFEIWNVEKGEVTYHNSWITNKTIDKDHVKLLTDCARARWKIENEYHNVLKHRGYNLEHNFGHGENHASEIFCLLNVFSYLMHGIQDIVDEDYKKARASFGRRDAFFWGLRYEMCHQSLSQNPPAQRTKYWIVRRAARQTTALNNTNDTFVCPLTYSFAGRSQSFKMLFARSTSVRIL